MRSLNFFSPVHSCDKVPFHASYLDKGTNSKTHCGYVDTGLFIFGGNDSESKQNSCDHTGPRFNVIRKIGEAGDRSCDPWIGSPACYPLHYTTLPPLLFGIYK